jgi:hypothetical protein
MLANRRKAAIAGLRGLGSSWKKMEMVLFVPKIKGGWLEMYQAAVLQKGRSPEESFGFERLDNASYFLLPDKKAYYIYNMGTAWSIECRPG